MNSSEANSSTALASAATPSVRRRESARAVIHRLHAIPVQLFPWDSADADDRCAVRGQKDGTFDVTPPTPTAADSSTYSTTLGKENTAGNIRTELGPNSVCLLTASAHSLSATVLGGPLAAAAVKLPLQRYTYVVAAAHALRGGRVLFLRGPACPSFSLADFTLEVEQQWATEAVRRASSAAEQRGTLSEALQSTARVLPRGNPPASVSRSTLALSSPPSTSVESQLRARQQAVMEAVARVEVLSCASMQDVYAVCSAYTFPFRDSVSLKHGKKEEEEEGVRVTRSNAASAIASPLTGGCCILNQGSPIAESNADSADLTRERSIATEETPRRAVDVIPLCVVDGLTGPTTVTTLQERATGQPIPIPHYLLCLLQRRLECALLVIELPLSTTAVASDARHAGSTTQPQQQQRFGQLNPVFNASVLSTGKPTSLPSEESVLADSDFVARLRVPHEHPPPPFASRGAADAAGNATQRSLVGKATRIEVPRRGSGVDRCSLSPVSLRNIQLCVLYAEVDGIGQTAPHTNAEYVKKGFFGKCSGSVIGVSPSGTLINPYSVSLRYRLHLLKTSLSDAPDNARSNQRLNFRGDEEDSGSRGSYGAPSLLPSVAGRNNGLRQSGGSCESGTGSARSSRRNSTALSPTYLGMWVHSSNWYEL